MTVFLTTQSISSVGGVSSLGFRPYPICFSCSGRLDTLEIGSLRASLIPRSDRLLYKSGVVLTRLLALTLVHTAKICFNNPLCERSCKVSAIGLSTQHVVPSKQIFGGSRLDSYHLPLKKVRAGVLQCLTETGQSFDFFFGKEARREEREREKPRNFLTRVRERLAKVVTGPEVVKYGEKHPIIIRIIKKIIRKRSSSCYR